MPYSISVSKLPSPIPAGDFIVSHLGFLNEYEDDLEYTRSNYNNYEVVATAHPSYDKSSILAIIMRTGNNRFIT